MLSAPETIFGLSHHSFRITQQLALAKLEPILGRLHERFGIVEQSCEVRSIVLKVVTSIHTLHLNLTSGAQHLASYGILNRFLIQRELLSQLVLTTFFQRQRCQLLGFDAVELFFKLI